MKQLIIIFALFALTLCANQRKYCTVKEKVGQVCFELYQPVCAIKKNLDGTYLRENKPNRCYACIEPNTEYIINGFCEAIPKEAELCKPNQSSGQWMCNTMNDPVCGYFDETIACIKFPCAQTYSNGCNACLEKTVAFYTKGECPQ